VPGAAGPRTDETRSLAHLVRELRDETTELLRQEIALVRAEVGDSVSRMLRNAGLLGVGALVALLGLVFILAAIATLIAAALADAGVEAPTAAWLGPMIVGVVVAVVGVAMVQKARSTLRRTHLYPDQTVETMRENAQWIRSRATTQRSEAS
jgi:hypothetical protein